MEQMMYKLNIPARVYYGRNIWRDALKEIEILLQGTVMIVTTGRSLVRLGYLDELKACLEEMDSVKKIVVFDDVSANPRLSQVRACIALGRREGASSIIGFGGGSALDAAKAAAAGMGMKEDISEIFYRGKELSESAVPVVAVPTTAGTGSELSRAAILTDELRKRKRGIRGSGLYPAAAVVDSVFTESVPAGVAMETGFDVLAHAVESALSAAASPYTRMLSEHAVRTAGRCLPRLCACPDDAQARESMSFASMMMGMNLAEAGTCLPHRLQYPLGAHTDTSHGAGLAALYPAWIGYEYRHAPEQTERILGLLAGGSVCGREECVETVRGFLASLGLPASLQELGAGNVRPEVLASEVTGNLKNDPAWREDGIILKIYEAARG